VSNRAPFIDDLFAQSGLRYGTNFLSQRSNIGSGEMGGFSRPAAQKICRQSVYLGIRPAKPPLLEEYVP